MKLITSENGHYYKTVSSHLMKVAYYSCFFSFTEAPAIKESRADQGRGSLNKFCDINVREGGTK